MPYSLPLAKINPMTVSLKKIVDGGFCIGCGACTCATDGGLPTELNLLGMYQVNIGLSETIRQDLMQDALHACPFSDDGPNEDELGKRLFDNGAKYDFSLGFYRPLYAGHVFEGNYRDRGASGGVITWVLTDLKKMA